MNKLKQYGLMALAATCVWILGACTEECEDYQGAQPIDTNCIRASFITSDEFTEFSPTEEKVLPVVLTRQNTNAEATVKLNVIQNDGNKFQVPESVTFAAGEDSKVFNITFSDCEIGTIYTYTVGLEEADVDSYNQQTLATTTGSVQIVQWNLLGEGNLYTGLFGKQFSCNVYQASHAQWYKAEGPLEEGKNMVFKVNEDNSVDVEDQAIYTHPSYGTIYVTNLPPYGGGGTYDPESNTITSTGYYHVGNLYFSTAGDDVLTIPTVE